MWKVGGPARGEESYLRCFLGGHRCGGQRDLLRWILRGGALSKHTSDKKSMKLGLELVEFWFRMLKSGSGALPDYTE